ncbi:hypothetical protein KKD19_04680 [Patescibacteria group bacterium]|nr:hypothetical protein [Patescibacteria group bacterium]MBU4512504.1 hypothetical protein [Patescibacteria group bacterium]MCG2693517.1 hypothetical protein [Candidatus Parcubacteria bacterium]
MQQTIKKILFRFPSKKGEQALNECLEFLTNKGIEFEVAWHTDESGKYFLAKSTNLDQGQIITSGANLIELDKNIKDAIYTAFNVPAYYCDYSKIRNINEPARELKYATI